MHPVICKESLKTQTKVIISPQPAASFLNSRVCREPPHPRSGGMTGFTEELALTLRWEGKPPACGLLLPSFRALRGSGSGRAGDRQAVSTAE